MVFKNGIILKILVLISYVAMVITNSLANILPINNITTGQVSDSFPNLFAPAGITFSIWGIIYILLAMFSIYQFFISQKENVFSEEIRKLFILSSSANIAWIFSWHYGFLPLTLLFMLIILITLIKTQEILNTKKISFISKIFIQIPFSVYFGWITVATIANITTFLVSVNWNGFGIADLYWTIIVLLAGVIIGTIRLIKDKQIAYGLVLIWAYYGIYIKHTSPTGFSGGYPQIITTLFFAIIVFALASIYTILPERFKR